MLEIKDLDKDFMCCGKRMELMPDGSGRVWTLGCYNCQRWAEIYPNLTAARIDEPVFIISDVFEIGSN